MSEEDRQIFADAYRFYAEFSGMANTVADWDKASDVMVEMFKRHGMSDIAEAILCGAYKAVQVKVCGSDYAELERTD